MSLIKRCYNSISRKGFFSFFLTKADRPGQELAGPAKMTSAKVIQKVVGLGFMSSGAMHYMAKGSPHHLSLSDGTACLVVNILSHCGTPRFSEDEAFFYDPQQSRARKVFFDAEQAQQQAG